MNYISDTHTRDIVCKFSLTTISLKPRKANKSNNIQLYSTKFSLKYL